jgi:hypothetical protein
MSRDEIIYRFVTGLVEPKCCVSIPTPHLDQQILLRGGLRVVPSERGDYLSDPATYHEHCKEK